MRLADEGTKVTLAFLSRAVGQQFCPLECRTGMNVSRNWRLIVLIGVILVYACVSLSLAPGLPLTSFTDITEFLLLLFASLLMAGNAVSSRGQIRLFWALIAAGCFMTTLNLGSWTLYEVILRRPIPEPFIGDVILFLHIVPLMAAVALRPHRLPEEHKPYFSTLNFLMLLVWWVFVYAFVIFPDQYVTRNGAVYTRNYDLLYVLENLALITVLAVLALPARAAWRRIYWNLFVSFALYTMSSEQINAAISHGQYYSGSAYDVPLVASIVWLVYAGMLGRSLNPSCESSPTQGERWSSLAPRLAMLAILSLPVMGYWAWFGSDDSLRLRSFRLFVSLAAILVLGVFVFIHQYLLDRELVKLLTSSRCSLENLERLQTQVVLKEKLASLGQMVAGAAHEINHPLSAILRYSELLGGKDTLDSSQQKFVEKIGQQAKRTQELVAGLLSFAQQSPGEKTLVDVGSLLQRALQVETLRMESKKIHVSTQIAPGLPPILGNANQLLQCCLEIIGNATDALEESGGGTFSVKAWQAGAEIIVEFADSGPGVREPKRVFDPFYTTKPIGKGAGLGLSVVYGVVQDHQGQINCENRSDGGAAFVLYFPLARQEVIAEDLAEATAT
jgi:signal transduction histidine kinase